MSDSTAKATQDQAPAESAVAVVSPHVVEAYQAMIATVPDAGGDGMDNILETLAMAQDLGDLNAPWQSDELDAFVDQALRITAIRKAPSDYAGGLPWFLIADAADLRTGERVTFTTGSTSVVAQLVKAWAMGSFPVDVIPRRSKRPTQSGNYAHHLDFIPAQGRGQA